MEPPSPQFDLSFLLESTSYGLRPVTRNPVPSSRASLSGSQQDTSHQEASAVAETRCGCKNEDELLEIWYMRCLKHIHMRSLCIGAFSSAIAMLPGGLDGSVDVQRRR